MSLLQIDFGSTKKSRVVGIDLGTTNSLVACLKGAAPEVIPGGDGRRLLPSVVSYTADGAIHTRDDARELLLTQPERTV